MIYRYIQIYPWVRGCNSVMTDLFLYTSANMDSFLGLRLALPPCFSLAFVFSTPLAVLSLRMSYNR